MEIEQFRQLWVPAMEWTRKMLMREYRNPSSVTALLAEDDADFRELMADGLRGDGYRVVEVDSGQELLERVDSEGWTFSGVSMPMPPTRMAFTMTSHGSSKAGRPGWGI